MACHHATITRTISTRVQSQTQARTDGPPEATMAAIVLIHLACRCLRLLSTYKISIGIFATWQELWVLAIVGSGFGMVGFRLWRGQGGAHLRQSWCLETPMIY